MSLQHAFLQGYERMVAWSDLLDSINVFPVADSDTGRNLTVSLAPLKQWHKNRSVTVEALMLAACGNSGNLAVAFLSEFLLADNAEGLAAAAAAGRVRAWQALAQPQPGTLLTVLDALVDYLQAHPTPSQGLVLQVLLQRLEAAVLETPQLLPPLRAAGVVDAGALGIFTYLEGFFYALYGAGAPFQALAPRFKDWLQRIPPTDPTAPQQDCVEAVIADAPGDASGDPSGDAQWQAHLPHDSASVVSFRNGRTTKIHLHTSDAAAARAALESAGEVLRWTAAPIHVTDAPDSTAAHAGSHIMTDAAGSITRAMARHLGITLLDSYIIMENTVRLETDCDAREIYAAMSRGVRVTTSQASVFERHQHYQSVLERYARVVYLCVGAVFTGNHAIALKWQQAHDAAHRLTVMDTTAASGRLALIVHIAARRLRQAKRFEELTAGIKPLVFACHEYIFLEQLRYLAAGGRLSRTSAFCGDLLRLKPVISPTAEGAKKVGVLRRAADQLPFALKQLHAGGAAAPGSLILLQYTDNQPRIEQEILPVVQGHFKRAEIMLQPLSLTTGVHTGPGSWGWRFLRGARLRRQKTRENEFKNTGHNGFWGALKTESGSLSGSLSGSGSEFTFLYGATSS